MSPVEAQHETLHAGRRTAGAPRSSPAGTGTLENFSCCSKATGAGRHERSMMFSGLRGIGKTVLLLEFDVLAAEAGGSRPAVQEVGSSADFRTSMARLAAGAAQHEPAQANEGSGPALRSRS